MSNPPPPHRSLWTCRRKSGACNIAFRPGTRVTAALLSVAPRRRSCLHLSRFRRLHNGDIVKDVQPLPDLLDTLRIPLFDNSNDLRVRWMPYQVCAAALHYGPTVHRGHYRALLRCEEKIWLTEDNQSADLQCLEQLAQLSAQTYLLWCRHLLGLGERGNLCEADDPVCPPSQATGHTCRGGAHKCALIRSAGANRALP